MSKKKESSVNINPIPESTIELILNPSAKAIGHALGGIVKMVFLPLIKLDMRLDSHTMQFKKKLEIETNKIDKTKIDEYNLEKTLKVFEDMKYQISSEDLRSIFAKLVAGTLNTDFSNEILPCYSTILKDLSTNDAKIFQYIYFRKELYTYTFKIYETPPDEIYQGNNNFTIYSNVILYEVGSKTSFIFDSIEVESLQRLGIIKKLEYNVHTASEKFEEYLPEIADIANKIYQEDMSTVNKVNNKNYNSLTVSRYTYQLTELGKRISKIVF